MSRYICVFYTALTLQEVSKKNKKVIVIKHGSTSSILTIEKVLKLDHQAKFIRYIRNLESFNIQFNNNAMKKIEEKNNYNLILENEDKS